MRLGVLLQPFAVVSWLLASPACAQAPVAIVEEIDSKSAGVEFMDYLTVGKTIALASADRLVIGYLKSCWRETITGGTVAIGTEESSVSGGRVERVKIRCQADSKGAVPKETVGSGAMVFRKKSDSKQPQQTIFGLSPVIEVGEARSLVIERLDHPDKPIQINLTDRPSARSRFVDLAKSNIALLAGASYKAKLGQREVIFRIDPAADPRSTGVVGRLVHTSPSG
jgi:hypothetical protein